MSRWSEADRAHMREALDLAARPGWRTHPNPMVGAVVVKDGRVVGRGWHRRPGGPHAEILSMRDAGRRARGATLYVTLEPCCHHGKTPPCTDAVIGAGVSRVVAAMRDPNPKVAGRGLRILRRNRIQVETGLLGGAARRLNEAFCRRVEENRPWVILKSAISLDGKIATASGDSKWITSAASRAHVHRLRDSVDAILAGIGAVLADDPRLTARPAGRTGRDPVRVILDSALRIPLKAKALNRSSPASIIVATTARAEVRRALALRDRGVEVWVPSLTAGPGRARVLVEEVGRARDHHPPCRGRGGSRRVVPSGRMGRPRGVLRRPGSYRGGGGPRAVAGRGGAQVERRLEPRRGRGDVYRAGPFD